MSSSRAGWQHTTEDKSSVNGTSLIRLTNIARTMSIFDSPVRLVLHGGLNLMHTLTEPIFFYFIYL
jgi:hypothetical protein